MRDDSLVGPVAKILFSSWVVQALAIIRMQQIKEIRGAIVL